MLSPEPNLPLIKNNLNNMKISPTALGNKDESDTKPK